MYIIVEKIIKNTAQNKTTSLISFKHLTMYNEKLNKKQMFTTYLIHIILVRCTISTTQTTNYV